MKKLFIFLCLLVNSFSIFATNLWSQDFTAIPANFYTTSGMTRNAGNNYSCAFGNYIYYTSSTFAYIETNTINVPQGKGIQLSFDSRRVNATAGTISVYYLNTGACSWDRFNPNNNGWVLWGTITPNTSAAPNSGCTNQLLNLESHVCGGQNIAIVMYFGSASSTNWISIDNLVVNDLGPTSVAVPNISGASTYTENFTIDKWYGPVTTGFNYSTTGIQIPYHSYRSASNAYTYLWNNGCNGTGNHSGVWSDYFAAFYTGFEFCGASSSSQIITKEINTSTCAAAEVKYAYMAKYPCGAGNFSYTFDESYDLYAPKLYTSIGQGYTWIQQAVNYYFPDGLWHFASYSVPSAANIKVRLARGGACTNPVEGVDNLKILCRDCSISALSGGTISGNPNPLPNTDYNYTITPTVGATYYKWMVRAIDRNPPVVIEAACPNGTDPCIVSGQGTNTVTINFGPSSLSENYRVMCIPFDANPGTLTNPSDACYANISILPVMVLPIELNYFKAIDLNGKIQLQWQTLSELSNDYFIIETSNDGQTFSKIGQVDGAGNSNEPISYSFDINQLFFGINYFRLHQINFDGSSDYSNTISVINESPQETISFFISNNGITIHTDVDVIYPLTFKLYDILGRTIFSQNNILIPENGQWPCYFNEIHHGIFFATLEGIGVHIKTKIIL